MRAVVQRVTRAEVRVDGVVVGAIGAGLAILLGVGRGDGDAEADRMAARLARLRVFPDADGRFDRSLLDTGGAALVVSQFTLYGDTARGNRPSFTRGRRARARRAALRARLRAPGWPRACARWSAAASARICRWNSSTTGP